MTTRGSARGDLEGFPGAEKMAVSRKSLSKLLG